MTFRIFLDILTLLNSAAIVGIFSFAVYAFLRLKQLDRDTLALAQILHHSMNGSPNDGEDRNVIEGFKKQDND